jgi:hypothetical protein
MAANQAEQKSKEQNEHQQQNQPTIDPAGRSPG